MHAGTQAHTHTHGYCIDLSHNETKASVTREGGREFLLHTDLNELFTAHHSLLLTLLIIIIFNSQWVWLSISDKHAEAALCVWEPCWVWVAGPARAKGLNEGQRDRQRKSKTLWIMQWAWNISLQATRWGSCHLQYSYFYWTVWAELTLIHREKEKGLLDYLKFFIFNWIIFWSSAFWLI